MKLAKKFASNLANLFLKHVQKIIFIKLIFKMI